MYYQETSSKSLEDLLLPLVEKAINAMETGADFVIDQTPIIVQQFMTFKLLEYSLIILISIIFMFSYKLVLNILTHKVLPKDDNHTYGLFFSRYINSDASYDNPYEICFYVLTIIFSITGIILFFTHIFSLLKLIVAPKLFLLEYFIDKV